MSNVKLPSQIRGEWIWKKSLLNRPDSFLMMRKEFVCSFVGLETNLWITANSSYQLFINGRFVGFGPRAHQSCDVSYVDQHDITYYLESGINVVAVLAYYNTESKGGCRRVPGVWCQVSSSRQEVIASDQSWFVREGCCFSGNRARISGDQGMTQIYRAGDCPHHWTLPTFMPDAQWSHPDYTVPVGTHGAKLELHPLMPPMISDEHPQFTPIARGKVLNFPVWTQVVFPQAEGNGEDTYAACTYLFSDAERVLAVRLYSDDPFKLFCNNHLVAEGARRSGEREDHIILRPGWNRLLLFQNPSRHSMGFCIIFPDDKFCSELRIYQDMVEESEEAWCTVGPLKLSLEAATPSLKFERLPVRTYSAGVTAATDPSMLLAASVFEVETSPDWSADLKRWEYLLYQLDTLRYGFVRVEVEAQAGDVIDISIGLRRTSRGFVSAGDGVRCTGTMVCQAGLNRYLTYIPGDCFYVMISVRHSKGVVRVSGISFDELYRLERHECLFRSSDELLNQFWEIGRQTLRRSAAFVPLSEARADYDCYLLDAYIDAVNMAACFGDFDYVAARLRQFVDAQLENGDIPVLTYGKRQASQIHHLFFFPVWINYNYRFSANLVELERAIPSLDLTREYFEAMLDENGLLVDVESRFGLRSRLSYGHFREGEIPTYLNALFCRFLLSSAELYRIVNQPETAKRCINLAQNVANILHKTNFDEKAQLFCRWQLGLPHAPDHNLFANFCAMFGGVLPLESFEHFFFSFFNFDPPYDRSEESAHPYFHFLFMEMMFALGQRDWAFRYFRDYWEKRISDAPGAWRVSAESHDPAPTRFSDGSCVSPNIFLLREVLGIRIAEAGHSVIYFNPAFNLVDWAEATIPMARGRLKVKWEKLEDGSLDVTLDSNIPVKILPEISHEILRNTTFRLGENVILLNPPEELVDEDIED